MKIVWHSNIKEKEWILYVLSSMITEQVDDFNFIWHGDNAIHVVSGNKSALKDLQPWLHQVRANGKNIALFHISDEWFSGHYEIYRYFDYVIRNYQTWLAKGPGIITLPLGPPNGMLNVEKPPKASTRSYKWSFAGEVKASRVAMVNKFSKIGPSYLLDTSKSERRILLPEYRKLVLESKFIPCPMGNVMLETWRLYEALEMGSIPIVEKRLTMDYYKSLFGQNPIPAFFSWKEASVFVDSVADDHHKLDFIQDRISCWWTKYKEELRSKSDKFLRSDSYTVALENFSDKSRNRFSGVHRGLQFVELLRHQTIGSLFERLNTTAVRSFSRYSFPIRRE